MNIRDQVFSWTRFWCPFGASMHCEESGQGFLTDPEDDFGRFHNKDLLSIEGIFQRRCFILCGEPAMGKTYTLRAFIEKFRDQEPSMPNQCKLIHLEFRSIPDLGTFKERCFQSVKWRDWLQSRAQMSLVIDGLDEGLIRIDRFLPFLTDELRRVSRDRLQLALSCRTLDWQRVRHQGEQLLSLWPKPKPVDGETSQQPVYTLCPLRQKDAVLAAEHCGIDATDFIRAVRTRGIVSLAARPYTLKMLLQEFAKHRSFPASRRDLYENFGLTLCSSDHDPDRAEMLRRVYGPDGVLSLQQLLKVASRLASLLMLGGKYAIHIGPPEDVTASDLPIADAYGFVEDADGKTFSVDQRAVLDTLATAIFSDRGPNRFGFDHQTMVECLTARYVQHMPLIQLRQLFCQRDASGEYVVPQLAQAAAWLGETRPDFFEHFLRIDPETLLRSETTSLSDDNKRRLLEALLEGAEQGEIFDDSENYYSGLKHSSIAAQLRPYITDRSLNIVVRRMALAIARECSVTELFDDVLQLTANRADCDMLGSAIGHALEAIAGEGNVLQLVSLARGEASCDPQDDLKGCALRALLRSRWTLTDALPCLTPPKEPHYFGSYEMVLKYELPSRVQRADLIPALTKMLTWGNCFDFLNPFHQIADSVLAEALKFLDDPAISELAVQAWMKGSREHSFARSDQRRSRLIKLLDDNEQVRLALATHILNAEELKKEEIFICVCYHDYGLLRPADPVWLLNEIEHAPEKAKETWAEAIAYMIRPEMAATYMDVLLEKRLTVPQLGKRFEWLRAWELDEPMARKAKADWTRRNRWANRMQRRQQLPDPQKLVADDLARIQAGDHTWWVAICNDLYLPVGKNRDAKADFLDITTWPGWMDSSSERQQELRRAARLFVLKHGEDTKQPGQGSNFASAGSRALWLLRDEIRSDPELLQAVSRQWIPVLVDGWANEIDQREVMAQLAYAINPQRTREYLAAAIKHEAGGESGYCFVVRNFRTCWDRPLSDLVKELILSEKLKPAASASLVEFLVEVDDEAALDCFLSAQNKIQDAEVRSELEVGIISGVFCHALAKHWVTVWPVLTSREELAKKVILRTINHGRPSRDKTLLSDLSEEQVGEVYRLVTVLFPPEKDPKIPSGVHDVTPDMEIPRFRSAILGALVAWATPKACAVIAKLAEEFPNQGIWIRWLLHEAVEMRRRRAWMPPAARDIIAMVRKTSLRRVETAYDLAEVVVESLQRLQTRLNRSPNPIVDEFWRFSRSGARREKFSPHYEEDIANRLASWLQDDLNGRGALIIGREVQPVWSQKTDIQVSAPSTSNEEEKPLTVIIEVKGCWNPRVREDLKDQLVDRYLALNREAVGIYLVGWFVCDRWDDRSDNRRTRMSSLISSSYEDASAEIKVLAAPYNAVDAPASVTGVLIDFRFPN